MLSTTFILKHIHSIYTKTKISLESANYLNWGGISTNQHGAVGRIRNLVPLFIQILGTSRIRQMSSLSLISYIFFSYKSPLNEKRHIICTVHTSTIFVILLRKSQWTTSELNHRQHFPFITANISTSLN
jgi:hypothetical protein